MKRLITGLLVLMLTMGLALPAMAFTTDAAPKVKHPYDLSVYLVEYDDNDFFGVASLPKTDRGYTKNEIVAAVAELHVPKGEEIKPDEYGFLVFGGNNVDLDVAENYKNGALHFATTSNVTEGVRVSPPLQMPPFYEDEIVVQIITLPGKNTYKWLFFAKVTGDDASLSVRLSDGQMPEMDFEISPVGFPFTLGGILYNVAKIPQPDPDDGFIYHIIVADPKSDYHGAIIMIYVDKNYKSTGMSIIVPPSTYALLGVTVNGELGVALPWQPAVLLTEGKEYDAIMEFYDNVVMDVFGLDYKKMGNYVRDAFFNNLISPDTLIATVDIAPWTAYVAVPDNIVADPPKTGDAVSLLGFAMVALAGAGAIVLKKRG